jgi:glycosyltransferase involved in cell wall biosynthesis
VGGDAVCYIDPTNPHQIAAEMLRIEGDPIVREKMVQNGRIQAEFFSWSIAAKKTHDFYENIISNRNLNK